MFAILGTITGVISNVFTILPPYDIYKLKTNETTNPLSVFVFGVNYVF
ncbi:MAG: hypothetical protein LBD03_07250 [Methanobrevibacter sp.]|jgi:hypothetical protein|nr:hypothetical protein [Candidatus Methanovirga procula]